MCLVIAQGCGVARKPRWQREACSAATNWTCRSRHHVADDEEGHVALAGGLKDLVGL